METATVDIPIETVNITWENAHELKVDEKYIEGSKEIAAQTNTAFTNQVAVTNFDLLFDLHKKCPVWGSFCVPKNFYSATNRFFTHNLLPWLKVEALIKDFEDTALENKINLTTSESAKAIYRLLNTMEDLSKMIEEILSRILQYRKG